MLLYFLNKKFSKGKSILLVGLPNSGKTLMFLQVIRQLNNKILKFNLFVAHIETISKHRHFYEEHREFRSSDKKVSQFN